MYFRFRMTWRWVNYDNFLFLSGLSSSNLPIGHPPPPPPLVTVAPESLRKTNGVAHCLTITAAVWKPCLTVFHKNPLDCLYDSLSSPPVAGVWWAHTLDCLYDSLSSPPVAGVWWEHTLDCLYDSLSSPPVAGVWWAHTLDCLYDSLSSPPVAGVWLSCGSRCIIQVDTAHWWCLMRESNPPPQYD